MWTRFYDMHSGGSQKTEWDVIYIQLPEEDAVKYFIKKFNRDPNNISCDCCGRDFGINEEFLLQTENGKTLVIHKYEIDNEKQDKKNMEEKTIEQWKKECTLPDKKGMRKIMYRLEAAHGRVLEFSYAYLIKHDTLFDAKSNMRTSFLIELADGEVRALDNKDYKVIFID